MNRSMIFLKRDLSAKGGLEKYTSRLLSAFKENRFSITLLTSTPENMLKKDPEIQVISYPLPYKMSFRKVKKFDTFCLDYLRDHSSHCIFGMDRNSFQTHLRAGNGVHAAYLKHRKENDDFLKRHSYHLNPLH